MITDDDVLQEIEAAIKRHDMNQTDFGGAAINDRNLVRQLRRKQRSLTLSTVNRIMDYIKDLDNKSLRRGRRG